MKRLLFILGLVGILSGCGGKGQNSLMITVDSKYNIAETISKFSTAIEEKGYTLTGTIDHTKRAKAENIYLKPTTALVLDNPKVFSALLTCNPSLAIDLPIRVSVYSLLGGAVKFSYTQPEYWSLKHNIKDKNCIAVIQQITRDFDETVEVITK
jgi:uncharacterized protein (DUF302 family)